MKSKFRAAPLISMPNLFVLALTFILVSVAIFLVLRLRPFVDGPDTTVVAVVHVEWHGAERRQNAVFATRDDVYFRNDERVGFLGLSSTCKQYRGVLPSELSVGRVRAIIEAPGFQEPVGNSGSTPKAWYVRTHVGAEHKCTVLSEEEASRNSDFIPLITWFRALEAGNRSREDVRGCNNEGSDYFDHWCDAHK